MDYIEEVSSIMEDIRENMDAVETVDYAIYAEIMKGYKVKLDSISILQQLFPNCSHIALATD